MHEENGKKIVFVKGWYERSMREGRKLKRDLCYWNERKNKIENKNIGGIERKLKEKTTREKRQRRWSINA